MNPFLDQTGTPVAAPPSRRTWGQRLVMTFNLVLITASLGIAGLLGYATERASAVNRVELDRSLTEVPETESGARVLNILLVGSDSSASLDPDDPIQIGRQGERFGDVIIVAHIDERAGSVALLSLPRDLWVPIAGTQRENRINRAFLVGGPATLIDTIEETFGIPIHHYVNVDFAGFQGLVEAVGSVDVQFDSPARDWNANARPHPRTQTGFIVDEPGCHSLGPEQALAYVRSRYYQTQDADGRWVTDPSSDLGRIRRQQDFLQRLLQKAIDRGARNPLVLGTLVDTGIEHVAIDQELTPALLVDLSNTYRSFDPGDLQTYTFPAVDGTVGANRVLIPQHELAAPLVELFDGEAFDSPRTVAVSLLYDESLTGNRGRAPAAAVAVAEHLRQGGIRSEPTSTIGLDRGLWLRHGPDGAHAAAIVADILAGEGPLGELDRSQVTIVEVGHLTGRNVEVTVGPSTEIAFAADPVDPATVVPQWTTGPTGPTAVDPASGDHELDEQPNAAGAEAPATTTDGAPAGTGAPEGPTEPTPDIGAAPSEADPAGPKARHGRDDVGGCG